MNVILAKIQTKTFQNFSSRSEITEWRDAPCGLMKKTRNISSLHLEHKRFAFHLDASSLLHAGRRGIQICDTFCHAMITRKHVAMETAITIVRRHISVAFLEQSRQQIVTNLETDHYTENRKENFDDINA